MKKRTALFFYVLSAYVLIQFIWWGYLLISLKSKVAEESSDSGREVIMIMGEGLVFLLILLVGIWQIRRSIKSDIQLSQRQNNFLLSVTHELKTPLAANKLYIQTIAKRDLDKAKRDELLQRAAEETDRLERMIDNILSATRLDNEKLSVKKSTVDLTALLHRIAERFEPISSAAKFTVEAPKQALIQADMEIVETVLSNLIENALKYAGHDAEIELYIQALDHKTIFGVKDNGPGVNQEDQANIFRKFYRAGQEETRTKKGTGLGLYIVSKLVHLHGCLLYTSDAADD